MAIKPNTKRFISWPTTGHTARVFCCENTLSSKKPEAD